MKVVPAYIEYNAVKGVISNMATSEEVKSGTVAQIRASFDKRASIAYVTVVKGEDLDITKDGNETVVTAAWSQRIPLFKNHTLLIDFSTSTTDK
ncbi:MAG: DUF4845 domain-containing protein [Betaproteobacteria bacterium]|nr:DUF4845 domain-containing protein [Betaproteobacteria bacterium]